MSGRSHFPWRGAEASALRAAAAFGAMVADGLLGRREALSCLVAVAAAGAAPGADPSGRRARLAHALADAARDRMAARARAWSRATAAIRPLVGALATGALILDAATDAAAGALPGGEVERLVAAAMLRRLGALPRHASAGRPR